MDPNDIYDDEDMQDPGKDEFEDEELDEADEDDEDQFVGLPEEEPGAPEPESRRSERISRRPVEYEPSHSGKTYATSHAQTETSETHLEYTPLEARVIAMIMCQLKEKGVQGTPTTIGVQHVITYSLKRGLQKFGERGKASTLKEMKQLVDRECFYPIKRSTMTSTERKRALESLIFLTEKRDGTIKSRHCANGSTQRDYMDREDVSSPTVSTEATMLTSVIEAEEERDVALWFVSQQHVVLQETRDGFEKDRIRS